MALAIHCFNNEYVYGESNAEKLALIQLNKKIKDNLQKKQEPTNLEITCLASYQHLRNYSWLHLLSVPIELDELWLRQILEPEEESKLRLGIKTLKKTSDDTSLKVKAQYEENPYPRWVAMGIAPRAKSIKFLVELLELRDTHGDVWNTTTPEILIAG